MRANNWPVRLDLFIEEKRNQPFSWLENNCAFFTADWLCILTGSDPAEKYRGMTEQELKGIFGSRSFDKLIEAIMQDNGWPEINVGRALRGDVVMATLAHGKTLGVCVGTLSFFPGERAIMSHPTIDCLTAWRIN